MLQLRAQLGVLVAEALHLLQVMAHDVLQRRDFSFQLLDFLAVLLVGGFLAVQLAQQLVDAFLGVVVFLDYLVVLKILFLTLELLYLRFEVSSSWS